MHIKKIEKAIRVINEMLIYRGMIEKEKKQTDIILPFENSNEGFMHYIHIHRIAIVFIMESKVSLNDDKSIIMKKLIPLLNFDEFDSIIFVFPEIQIKSNTKLEILLKLSNKTYEFWDIEALQYNPSIHNLVPFHKKLPNINLLHKAILDKYQIKDISQLPWILEDDPMARFIFAQENDIIEIYRRSPTSGEHIVHRVCKH